MTERHLVRGQTSGWFIAGRFLGPVVMVAGVIMMFATDLAGGIAVVVIGLLVVAFMEALAAIKRSQRVWIEVLPDGFIVADRKGQREHRDHEVVSISYSWKQIFNNGDPAGYTRKCQLWFTAAPQVVMDTNYKEGEVDPLGGLIDRILQLLKAGYAAAIEHGIPVHGDGWQLTKQELRCTQKGHEEAISLGEISAVETYEGNMGVWLRGQDLPTAKFPIDGRNVWLLPALLEPYISKQTADGPPQSGLGRVLFNRKSTKTAAVGCYLASAICLLGGIPLILFGLREPGAMVAGVIAVLLVPVFILCGWHFTVAQFRCHEWGVFQAGMFGQQQLLYKDVAWFSYNAVRHFHNGVYTGTALSLKFDPMPGAGAPIAYSTSVQGADDDIEKLKDFISRVIAGQMHERLAAGEEVRWTNNLTFRPDGIVYRPAGWVGRKEPAFLPFEQYGGYNLDQGVFYLFAKGTPKAVMTENFSEANFFPGYYLLLMMLDSPADGESI